MAKELKDLTQEELVALIEKERKEAAEVVSQLTAKLKETEEKAAAVPVVAGQVVLTHERAKYKVVAPKFSFEGKDYAAEDLAKDKELVAKLVEIGSGILVKI